MAPEKAEKAKRRRIDWDEGELALVADAFVAQAPDTLAESIPDRMERAQSVLPPERRRTGFTNMATNRRFMEAVQARLRRLLAAGPATGQGVAEGGEPGGLLAKLEATEKVVESLQEVRLLAEKQLGEAEAREAKLREENGRLREAVDLARQQREDAQAQAAAALAMPTEKLIALLLARGAAALADVKGGLLAEVGGIVGGVREEVGQMRRQVEARMQRLEMGQASGPRGAPAVLSPAPALTALEERSAYMPMVLVAARADWRADFQRLQEALRPLKIRLGKIDTSKPSQMRVDAHDVLFVWRCPGVSDELVAAVQGRSRKCRLVQGTLADLQAAIQDWVEGERRPKASPAEANGVHALAGNRGGGGHA